MGGDLAGSGNSTPFDSKQLTNSRRYRAYGQVRATTNSCMEKHAASKPVGGKKSLEKKILAKTV